MNNHMNQSAIQASSISLMPYYILGLVGTGMGILVVAVLRSEERRVGKECR